MSHTEERDTNVENITPHVSDHKHILKYYLTLKDSFVSGRLKKAGENFIFKFSGGNFPSHQKLQDTLSGLDFFYFQIGKMSAAMHFA